MSVPSALVEALLSAAAPGTCKLPAAEFQAVLRSHGLSFGHPVVDALMLKSRIDEAGLVDFSAAAAGANEYPYDSRRPSGVGPSASSGVYGAAAPVPASPAFASPRAASSGDAASQVQRVRAHTKDIAARLADLELCRISVAAFRVALEEMGIVETPDAARLLRQSTVPSFAALYRALLTESVAPSAAAQGGGTCRDASALSPCPRHALHLL